MEHTLKLSTGKEITLTSEEYEELKSEFREIRCIPDYRMPAHPFPKKEWNKITCCGGITRSTF